MANVPSINVSCVAEIQSMCSVYFRGMTGVMVLLDTNRRHWELNHSEQISDLVCVWGLIQEVLLRNCMMRESPTEGHEQSNNH